MPLLAASEPGSCDRSTAAAAAIAVLGLVCTTVAFVDDAQSRGVCGRHRRQRRYVRRQIGSVWVAASRRSSSTW
jgi:hypothetical protein